LCATAFGYLSALPDMREADER